MCAREPSQRAREGIDLSPDSKLEPKKCGGFGVLSGAQSLGAEGKPVASLARFSNPSDLAGILWPESARALGFAESGGGCVLVFKTNAKKGTCDAQCLLFSGSAPGGRGMIYTGELGLRA